LNSLFFKGKSQNQRAVCRPESGSLPTGQAGNQNKKMLTLLAYK